MKTAAIILAAGMGTRLARGPKAFVSIGGQSLLARAIALFESVSAIDGIVIVAPRAELAAAQKLAAGHAKVVAIVAGGATRAESLQNGLKKTTAEMVVIHNVANPHATAAEVRMALAAAAQSGAAAVARVATATVKRARDGFVSATLPRAEIWLTETPQAVRKDLLVKGLQIARKEKLEITDDVQLAELAGATPRLVPAAAANRKITTAADLPVEYRTGLGQDSHRFETAPKPLFLAGVRVAATGGLAGNSDADVVLHALVNAISSALGGGSISNYADKLCAAGEQNSAVYLAAVLEKLSGWRVVNVSVGLEAARPKLEKHLPKMNARLARLLGVPVDCVGSTVTSGEGLTACGRGEGIAATVSVLLAR